MNKKLFFGATILSLFVIAGVAWAQFGPKAINFSPVRLSDGLAYILPGPIQGATLFNSETTGAADTAVTLTIAAAANTRAHVYTVDARCSATTSSVTITDGGFTRFSTTSTEIGTTRTRIQWPVGLTGLTNSAVVVTLATCGAANTGTLSVQADRY